METQQQEFSETVTVRYRCTWQEFELAVRSVGSVTASSYCKSFHVNYRGMTKWMSAMGQSAREESPLSPTYWPPWPTSSPFSRSATAACPRRKARCAGCPGWRGTSRNVRGLNPRPQGARGLLWHHTVRRAEGLQEAGRKLARLKKKPIGRNSNAEKRSIMEKCYLNTPNLTYPSFLYMP